MSSFVGTGTLVRLGLRRDRITLPSWLYLIVILVVTTAASFASLYPNVTGRLRFGASIASNPGLIALTGPIYDASTIGGLIAWRLCAFGAVLTGLCPHRMTRRLCTTSS